MSVYDNYELYENIGHGSSCTVKRAIRKDSGQVFAAKLYESSFLNAKNQIEMLVRLDHPNIVNIYEVFQQDNCIILILEYMQGGDLYEYIAQKTEITELRIMEYMKIIVDAIRYCHDMNTVHRDIKPENLLLSSNTPEGLLKLADFGISKIMSDQMLTTNCGTPIYMAPEIWSGKIYDNKVDVWGVGVVMYYLLSGTHPFEGDNQTVGQKIKFDQLKFEGNAWNKISSKAIDLLRKLLQKDPLKRISAQQATAHIWFSQFQLCKSPSFSWSDEMTTMSEIPLSTAVMKIKRFNFKNKIRKSKKKLQSISQHHNLRNPHLKFLTEQSQNTQYSEYTEAMEIQQSLQIHQ